jgi:UDPglucose--hexose-1-phosphate uridylyltransferase
MCCHRWSSSDRMTSVLSQTSHRRLNPLTNEWVLVSPQRTSRPWQGQLEKAVKPSPVEYDPDCYLCPRNTRAGGKHNPDYRSTFVFDNDFPALLPGQLTRDGSDDIFRAQAAAGICRVGCFSPRHDLTLPLMESKKIEEVLAMWTEQFRELSLRPDIRHVQIFENRGEMMGASNPHPHCQIWASSFIPTECQKECSGFQEYRDSHQKCVLCDYVEAESRERQRTIFEDDQFVVVVPFWAVWPFEVLVLPKAHVSDLIQLSPASRDSLASALRDITTRYDNLFDTAFPYTMGFHQPPTNSGDQSRWHLHAHYYPPLLRSASIRKFMVGYELLASPQRDITPEAAAERLRNVPTVHYSLRSLSA